MISLRVASKHCAVESNEEVVIKSCEQEILLEWMAWKRLAEGVSKRVVGRVLRKSLTIRGQLEAE